MTLPILRKTHFSDQFAAGVVDTIAGGTPAADIFEKFGGKFRLDTGL
jgi:hypothetical protein